MVLGISFDAVADQKSFADEQKYPYKLLSDSDKAVGALYDTVRQPGEQYQEYGLPRRVTYLIDPEGVIRNAYNAEAEGVDLAQHAAQVLEDIKAAS